MTPGVAFVLIGLGALAITGRTERPVSLRDQTLEAQRLSALASQRARDLAARWSAEQITKETP